MGLGYKKLLGSVPSLGTAPRKLRICACPMPTPRRYASNPGSSIACQRMNLGGRHGCAKILAPLFVPDFVDERMCCWQNLGNRTTSGGATVL